MRNNYEIFGAHAFRKHYELNDRRSVINVALFDVFSVLLSNVDEMEVKEAKGRIREQFFRLMQNPQFMDAISLSTNSTRKVRDRFTLVFASLREILPNVQHAQY